MLICCLQESGHGLSEITVPGGKVGHSAGLQDPAGGFKLSQSAESFEQLPTSEISQVSKVSAANMELSKLAPGCELGGGGGGFSRQVKPSNGFALAPGAELNNGKGLLNEYNEAALIGAMYHHQLPPKGIWTQPELTQTKSVDAMAAGYLPPALMLPVGFIYLLLLVAGLICSLVCFFMLCSCRNFLTCSTYKAHLVFTHYCGKSLLP